MSTDLPEPGERPVFGVHRLPAKEANSAPAFKVETEQQKQERFVRELREWARKQPPEPVPEESPD